MICIPQHVRSFFVRLKFCPGRLKDWWALQSRDHYVLLENRPSPPKRKGIGY